MGIRPADKCSKFQLFGLFFQLRKSKTMFLHKKSNQENKIFFPATESFVITLKLKFLLYMPSISGR